MRVMRAQRRVRGGARMTRLIRSAARGRGTVAARKPGHLNSGVKKHTGFYLFFKRPNLQNSYTFKEKKKL